MILVLVQGCHPPSATDEGPANRQTPQIQAVEMRYLDWENPSLVVDVSDAQVLHQPKFVIVEIGHVSNPELVPLSFAVGFRSVEGRDVALGMFSLYPPNQPGRFIVATQGKVVPGGEIIVTMNAAEAPNMTSVRVGVSSVTVGPE